MSATMSEAIEPLVKRKIFASEEEAIRELLKGYILQQITTLPREIARLERKCGMRLRQRGFSEYLRERSVG